MSFRENEKGRQNEKDYERIVVFFMMNTAFRVILYQSSLVKPKNLT